MSRRGPDVLLVGDQALAGELVLGLGAGRVRRREQDVGAFELVVRHPGADLADVIEQRSERLEERRLVAALGGGDGGVVELVEVVAIAVVDPELTLAHDPDDHAPALPSPSSPCGAPPVPSSAFIFASSSST